MARPSGLSVITRFDLESDASTAAARALNDLPDGPLLVHVDVDVLDFVDAPLAKNTDGRSGGPSLEQLLTVLKILMADPPWAVLSVTEINPTRSAGVPDLLPRVCEKLAGAHRTPGATGVIVFVPIARS